MNHRLSLVTAPEGHPISIPEAKAYLRVDGDTEDETIEKLVGSATGRVESFTERALLTQTWEMRVDRFPSGRLDIPLPPLRSIESIKYLDTDGVEQTLVEDTDYIVDVLSGPRAWKGAVYPLYGVDWPATRNQPNAVTVRFEAGYGDAGDVPDDIRVAILQTVGDAYEHREGTVVGTITARIPQDAQAALQSYRVNPVVVA